MSSSDRNSPPLPSPAAPSRRRSSIAGSFVDLFGQRPAPPTNDRPNMGPITSAAAQAQQRRLSLTTVGLGASPNQSSPFGSVRSRGESISSSTSGTVDESPFEDGDAQAVPASPFARRMSFGARAMRDIRSSTGNGSANGRATISSKAKAPPTANNGRVGQGYDFAENLRSRAERSSISGGIPQPTAVHQRAKSVTVMEPPQREMPKQPKMPDAFQERILKGDFYMD
ncbi:hypothetical protein BLS_004498 [Venturia inaequalis]|uniref:Uncharacterized protein n=1 Tax=Venturia inaequalis TaxID=5025 RepID=A0A8H3UL21_VENIN|nr:hypothetical protein BLS_004498 [Venturia inaequalis]